MNAARRAWLQRAALAACAMQLPRWAWANPQPWQQDPFALGVASGEPGTHSLVLWTRLAGAPPQLPAQTVHWELAHDAQFRRPVQRGQALAAPEWGHSVHVQLQGLQPGRWYFYRFPCGGATSATGRTRTAPAAGELPAQLRLVFASCQRWEHGQYAAWWHAAQDAPDLVLFLGDYIYEYASPRERSTLARSHELPLARTLQDYRDRYALHKSDPLLQAAHAACPWAVTWDDHEVENDWAGSAGRAGPDGAQAFAPQRAAAFQAYYENMPLSATAWLQGGLQLYRSLDWGQLARIHLLDDRQYRDWQACRQPGSSGAASVRARDCPSLHDRARTLLGPAQEQWLAAQLAQAPARWSVLAQQTLFSPRHYPSGLQSTDNWDGYPQARQRLVRQICPLCREKYGNTNGEYQEQEGAVLVRAFLADTGMTEAQIARVAYLVGHHHTLRNIHGPDYQILIEADYIANASENGYSKQSVMHFMDTVMKTASGKHLAASVLGISASNLGCAGR